MKVLVTGATGFVGRHVIPRLLEHGHTVTAVARDETKARNFSWFDRVRFVACDIHRPIDKPVELFGNPEAVIHLAWPGLPNYKALVHFEEALPADYRFLKTLVEGGVDRLLVTGTCFEYGMQSGALREDMETRPTNPYGFAKDTLRRQLEYLKNEQSFMLTWARLFYLYGDGQAENSLLPQLKAAVERGDKVFNMSGGEQLRDYLPITEVAKCLVSLAIRNGDNGIVNVCSGKPISVLELVEGWIKENDWSIKLNLGYYPYTDYEPMTFWGDRQKLDRYLESH
jgi:dTDP-6-deoxy-L-talose 4-dehydrogenase (NAD+)